MKAMPEIQSNVQLCQKHKAAISECEESLKKIHWARRDNFLKLMMQSSWFFFFKRKARLE
jgi:hypothetical protein